MSTDHKVTCDACGRDLTSSGNSVDWRLSLANVSVPSRGGFVTDMLIEPALSGGNKDFCGVDCLGTWLADAYPRMVQLTPEYARRREAWQEGVARKRAERDSAP